MRRGGHTLAEVLLAIALLTVAVLTIVGLVSATLASQSNSQGRYVASLIGRELLEAVTRAPSGTQPASGSWDGRAGDAAVGGFPPLPYPAVVRDQRYVLKVGVRPAQRGLRCLQVEVFFRHGSVLLETYAP